MVGDDFYNSLKRSLYLLTFSCILVPWIIEIAQLQKITWRLVVKSTIISATILGVGLISSTVALNMVKKYEKLKNVINRDQRELTYLKKINKNLINRMGVNIELIDEEYTILFANKELKSIFGDIEGRKCYEVYMNKKEPCFDCPAIRTIEKNEPSTKIVTCKDGKIYEFICVPFENEGKRYAIGSKRDITEKRKLEMSIEHEKDKLNTILMSMGDGVAIVDSDFKITYANKRLIEFFGEDIIGKPCYKAYGGFESPCEHCPILKNDIEKLKNIQPEVIEITTKKGKSFLITHSPIKNTNGKYSILEIVKDITELKQIDKMKDELITNVSHELKTPLTVAKGMIELLSEEIKDEENKEILNVAKRNIDRLHQLINDLIEIAKMKSGHPLNLRDNDLRREIERAVRELSYYAKNRKVEVVTNLPDKPIIMKSNKYKLFQVFYHLINNGIKFNKENGKLIISAKNTKNFIEVTIEDTGIGIPEEHIDKIFDKFYQVESGMTRRFPGMGIGLTMVKKIVELHNGKIFVESKVNKGTKFTLIFPLN